MRKLGEKVKKGRMAIRPYGYCHPFLSYNGRFVNRPDRDSIPICLLDEQDGIPIHRLRVIAEHLQGIPNAARRGKHINS